jgi:predicted SprT family Zn-dependent metalloprotease
MNIEHGTVFRHLTVLKQVTTSRRGNKRYRCGCICGYSGTIARGTDLRSGKVWACVKCKLRS